MHLSFEEILEKGYELSRTAADFERWEATFFPTGSLVFSNERAAEAEDSGGTAWRGTGAERIREGYPSLRAEVGRNPEGIAAEIRGHVFTAQRALSKAEALYEG